LRDVLIAIVQNFPAMLAAFGQIVRFGDDDDERLTALETVVSDLRYKLDQVQSMIEHKKTERTS